MGIIAIKSQRWIDMINIISLRSPAPMDKAYVASRKSFRENSTVKAQVVIKALILLMSKFIATPQRKSDRYHQQNWYAVPRKLGQG